jgi:hypothetical protein
MILECREVVCRISSSNDGLSQHKGVDERVEAGWGMWQFTPHRLSPATPTNLRQILRLSLLPSVPPSLAFYSAPT